MPGDHRAAWSGAGDRARRRLVRGLVGGAGVPTSIRPVERAYRQSIRALGILLAVVGVAMVTLTLARGGGALALGVVVGLLLAAVGAGRALLAGRPGDRGA